MTPFSYVRASDAADAVRLAGVNGAKFLGGGTNLVDLMRETIERPTTLIDITSLSSHMVEDPDGGLRIGAAARNIALRASSIPRRRRASFAAASSWALGLLSWRRRSSTSAMAGS